VHAANPREYSIERHQRVVAMALQACVVDAKPVARRARFAFDSRWHAELVSIHRRRGLVARLPRAGGGALHGSGNGPERAPRQAQASMRTPPPGQCADFRADPEIVGARSVLADQACGRSAPSSACPHVVAFHRVGIGPAVLALSRAIGISKRYS